MTIQAWLDQNTKRLATAGIGTARLDCLVLLEDCLHKNRTHILANPHLLIGDEHLDLLNSQMERRSTHEPLAYIRGKTEFYGRNFFVDKRVLEPRPESESMLELLSRFRSNDNLKIVDVGTGSGALAITAKLEIPHADVVAIDIDIDCLDVARQNAKNLAAEITFKQGDLLEPLASQTLSSTQILILLCNLPYVPDNFHINPAAEAEPQLAIFGGRDGLDVYRRLFKLLESFAWRPDTIFTEALPPQHEMLTDIAAKASYRLARTDDFIQQFEPASKTVRASF